MEELYPTTCNRELLPKVGVPWRGFRKNFRSRRELCGNGKIGAPELEQLGAVPSSGQERRLPRKEPCLERPRG